MKFFSSNSYIFLPTKNNPKVALCVDNTTFANNAFKLYNPFSLKAKIFKSLSKFFYINLNFLTSKFSIKKEKNNFIIYLEKLFRRELHISLYFATAKDKIVLQLQSNEAKIVGYLKYPLNDIGLKHITNEIKAYEILSSNNVIESYILSDIYNEKPFIVLKELDGTIDKPDRGYIDDILRSFEKNSSQKLLNHPRILELKNSLLKYTLDEYTLIVESICNNSKKDYKIVYEHGDFTPWNVIKVKDSYIPFDFEYFVEDGIEYFDILKYYYQIGRLLESKKDEELYYFVKNKLKIEEIKELFILFLIKEIIIKRVENISFEFEKNLINKVEKL